MLLRRHPFVNEGHLSGEAPPIRYNLWLVTDLSSYCRNQKYRYSSVRCYADADAEGGEAIGFHAAVVVASAEGPAASLFSVARVGPSN